MLKSELIAGLLFFISGWFFGMASLHWHLMRNRAKRFRTEAQAFEKYFAHMDKNDKELEL